MKDSRDATDYALALAELATRIQDSHATLASARSRRLLRHASSAGAVELIEGQTVVTEVAPEVAQSGLRLGDIVHFVDGEAAAARRERLRRYLPASTPGRLENKIDIQFLLGPQSQPAVLEVRGEDGGLRRASAPRTLEGLAPRTRPRTGPVYTVLPAGVGYLDLQRLEAAQVNAAFETVRSAPAVILDMRGYPSSGASALIPRLARPDARPTVIGGTPRSEGSSGSFSLDEGLWTSADGSPRERYAGRLVVLADGSSQSAAERVCLLIESVAAVTSCR